MKTLDIFHTWLIIYVIVTKTIMTFLQTFNFCFTEKKYDTILKEGGGGFPLLYPTLEEHFPNVCIKL